MKHFRNAIAQIRTQVVVICHIPTIPTIPTRPQRRPWVMCGFQCNLKCSINTALNSKYFFVNFSGKIFLFQVTLRGLGTDQCGLSMGKVLELIQCIIHGVLYGSVSVAKV